MKVLLALSLAALALSAVHADDKARRMLQKWAHHKAMEGCFGKDAVRQYMIKKKKASAKCMQRDAPELDLPMFKNPYRTVDALLDGAYGQQQQQQMRPGQQQQQHQQQLIQAIRPQQGASSSNDDDYLDTMLRKVFLKRMLTKMLEEEYASDDNDDIADDDEDDGMGQALLGPMRFFRRPGRRNNFLRQKRQAPSSLIGDRKEMYELGDRLTAKLRDAKERWQSKIGNYTCMLQECGVIDEDGELASPDKMISEMRKLTINGDDGDRWLRNEIENNVRLCHKFAQSVPQEMLDACPYGPQLAKVKKYKKCMKMNKCKTCMHYDIKQQLEENFGGSLDDLVETTQLEQKELLPLVMELLHGPEVYQ